jgi:serine/threonine protein kinase
VVLIDFGLSYNLNKLPFISPSVGTPGYSAPEVIDYDEKIRYTNKCDMFSLGVLFHNM